MISLSSYLDRKPSVEVFEIERSLVFAECQSVLCAQVLHLLITVYNEYLENSTKEAERSTLCHHQHPSLQTKVVLMMLQLVRQRQDEHAR